MIHEMTPYNPFMAAALAERFSKELRKNLVVVAYPDPKNGRIVCSVYDNTHELEVRQRIGRQIKTNKAVVFCYGQRMDDSIYLEA